MSSGNVAFCYLSIGNSDDKLSQYAWSELCAQLEEIANIHARQIHGVWHSLPSSCWQNMCIAIEVYVTYVPGLKVELARLAGQFDQDSIAMAVAEKTIFITALSV